MAKTESKHYIIVAGEDSGDLHASHLISAIKDLCPKSTFSGVGGKKMQKAGVALIYNLAKLAVVGFVEIIKNYSQIKNIFNSILKEILEQKPTAVILVDYPGFNLRLAKAIKQQNKDIKIFYYISPQIWAWKKNRVYHIKKYIDHMLVLFSFEEELYKKYNIPVTFVGHPLMDEVKTTCTKNNFLNQNKLKNDNKTITIGLLPGSRRKEVETILPIMFKALKEIKANTQAILIKAPSISKDLFKKIALDTKYTPNLITNHSYDAINACDICLVASGTATLEVAILGKPMLIIYKTSFLTWILAKLLIKIPYIGLVNIVSQKLIAPEFIQYQANPDAIRNALLEIINNKSRMEKMKTDLKVIPDVLGSAGASLNAAEVIVKESN